MTDFDELSTEELLAVMTTTSSGLGGSPLGRLATTVGIGSMFFHWAEAGKNPQIKTVADSIHYIATSLSVGYSNIFPTTPMGKLVGAWVMMIGPALAAKALDEPTAATSAPTDPELIARLDAILTELKKSRTPALEEPGSPALFGKLDAILGELRKLNDPPG